MLCAVEVMEVENVFQRRDVGMRAERARRRVENKKEDDGDESKEVEKPRGSFAYARTKGVRPSSLFFFRYLRLLFFNDFFSLGFFLPAAWEGRVTWLSLFIYTYIVYVDMWEKRKRFSFSSTLKRRTSSSFSMEDAFPDGYQTGISFFFFKDSRAPQLLLLFFRGRSRKTCLGDWHLKRAKDFSGLMDEMSTRLDRPFLFSGIPMPCVWRATMTAIFHSPDANLLLHQLKKKRENILSLFVFFFT